LGYSDLHKGYKCLDIPSGQIYISRDAIFDEDIFPFSKLHPNAGACLQSDVELLHPTLITPTIAGVGHGDGQSTDILPVTTNPLSEVEIQEQTEAVVHEEVVPSENGNELWAHAPNSQGSSSGSPPQYASGSAPCTTSAREANASQVGEIEMGSSLQEGATSPTCGHGTGAGAGSGA
jgi:hypothetical protein